MPDGMRAWIGESRAMENAVFVKKQNGCFVPKYAMLVPRVDGNGSLTGVEAPGVIRIGDKK
jgi:hypothetical protein